MLPGAVEKKKKVATVKFDISDTVISPASFFKI